jgi:hypothetical protein
VKLGEARRSLCVSGLDYLEDRTAHGSTAHRAALPGDRAAVEVSDGLSADPDFAPFLGSSRNRVSVRFGGLRHRTADDRSFGPARARYSARTGHSLEGFKATALLNPVLNLEILDATEPACSFGPERQFQRACNDGEPTSDNVRLHPAAATF